jgi:hypothetical protein
MVVLILREKVMENNISTIKNVIQTKYTLET